MALQVIVDGHRKAASLCGCLLQPRAGSTAENGDEAHTAHHLLTFGVAV